MKKRISLFDYVPPGLIFLGFFVIYSEEFFLVYTLLNHSIKVKIMDVISSKVPGNSASGNIDETVNGLNAAKNSKSCSCESC